MMLEIKLDGLKSAFKALKIWFPIFGIVLIISIPFFDKGDENPITTLCIVAGALLLVYGYFWAKYRIEIRALSEYIIALKSRNFQAALTFGRVYYSIKRKGLMGTTGNGLSVYDEQAINNDITAYSRI